jgi:hypothetical protein
VIATVDTNVLVSGTLFGGVPGTIISAAVDRRFTLALSPAILNEYEEVLSRSKFGLAIDAVEVLVRDMESHAFVVHPKKLHQIVADDPDDDAVIDCAVEANADIIVSGDGHLTELKQIEGMPVITPAKFIEMLV